MSKEKALQMLSPYSFFQNKIVKTEDANITIASNSLQYGTTCFGGIRGYFNGTKAQVFRLYDHFIRLMNATKMLGIELKMTWEYFEKAVKELVRKNSPTSDFYIRPFVYTQDPNITPCFDHLEFELAIYMFPLKHYFDPSRGLKLMVSSWQKVPDMAIPSKAKAGGAYINSALAKTEATKNGYDEALMMDGQGNIVEASAANIFIVWRKDVIMPETGSAMLEGITRRTVLELLEEEGIKVLEERIDRSMIYSCDEILLTGTAAQVVFAETVDQCVIAPDGRPGPIFKLLQRKFQELIEGNHKRSSEWLFDVS